MTINPSEFVVLVVDDILSNIMLLKAILMREKYKVLTATSGKDAIAIIEKTPPDILLLDVMMPEMNGYQVCTYIRKELKLSELPIILLTALNSNEDIVKGFSVEANDFVSKPFNNDVLLMRLRFQLSVVASTRIIKQQSEELASTITSRDKLYSVIAHDLRSPLATTKMIMNYVVEKIKEYDLDADLVEMLQNVNSIAEDAFNLFDNLLKWTKSQVGRLNWIPQKIEVSELTETSLDVLKIIAINKNIHIVLHKPEEKFEVNVDIDMMKTVYRNLISNAIKFSPEGSEIDVEIEPEDEYIKINIRDHGCGMGPEEIQKILAGKVDFSKPGTNNESGSGLGLLLTREFIKRNGGELTVTSEIGKGSVFSFSIPK